LDVESEEEFVEKSGDYFEMLTSSKDNVPSAVGSGPIFVRFSYSNSSQGLKVPFPPLRVANQQQVDHIEALVNHHSLEYVRKLTNTAKEKSQVLNADVSIAECNLPKDIVKHIKSCFTKSKIDSLKPGRRTHKGVKKSEKFIPKVKNVIPFEEEPFIPPSGPSTSSRSYAHNIDESVESCSEPREYFLRSLLPKLNASISEQVTQEDSKLQHIDVADGDDDDGATHGLEDSFVYNHEENLNLETQEIEKIVDIESLRKKRIYDDDEEDEGEILPTEEEFYEALETEVFGDMLPKVIQGKGPRKGISERDKGSGGRNEYIKKVDDEQCLKGVDYLLGAADPSNDGPIDTPDFAKIFRPKTRKQRLKLEDLEEDEDEDFKVPGVRKTQDGQERRSRRLGVKKEQLESGEYYKSEQKILVKLSEDKDVKPIVNESIVDECDEILNHFNS